MRCGMSDDFDLNLNYEGSEDEFYIDFARVANTEDLLPTVRLTALSLSNNPYLSLGDWFKGLNENSFKEVYDMVNETFENHDAPVMEQLMLLTMMLSSAEGTLIASSNNLDELGKQMEVFRNYVAIVSLERKGLVRVFYENLTLGGDMGDKIVVEKI